ncbi:glycosyltransferase family 1 protein [Hypoxylon fragiforme]|uniref:glycosyltransferase family 1 protein n=1 Tax=Hypoxylon fragiforme TaxID=63214 RepID=UPI0020C6B9B4|nr:glycosyltransferase family 1 protein [Hypoxylon fragiforme]KAI2605804.1 glycosyltransferase family 1 protein [Hypoxylon fragiforme]
MSAPRRKERIAFVTIGASASFQPLIAEVLSPDFIAKLRAARFTHLIVQYGPDLRCFDAAKPAPEGLNDNNSLIVTGFAYKESLRKEMELTTAKETSVFVREKGLIVTHAGSGSILDALDFDTTVIAVPNPSLMDNHQSEIATEMENEGFLIQGKLGSLATLINDDTLTQPTNLWPPEPTADTAWQGGLWEVINSLMPQRKLSDRTAK